MSLNPDHLTLSQYLLSPEALLPETDFGKPALLSALARFYRPDGRLLHRKLTIGREVCETFAAEEHLRSFRLCVDRSCRAKGYMRDGGDIFLSVGLLLRPVGNVFLALCHELGHMWLSEQPDYAALKALDLQFLKSSLPAEASPLEICADVLSLRLAQAVLPALDSPKKQQRLTTLVENEYGRLRRLEQQLADAALSDPFAIY